MYLYIRVISKLEFIKAVNTAAGNLEPWYPDSNIADAHSHET